MTFIPTGVHHLAICCPHPPGPVHHPGLLNDCFMCNPTSGAPIVAEQGAPDDGPGTSLPVEPTPPAPGIPGPSSLTANEAVEAAAKAMHELARHRDKWGSAACHGSGCMPRYRTLARAALGAAVDYPQTDDGVVQGPPLEEAAPSSLTAAMQVERCRVLLEQWRKDRLLIGMGLGEISTATHLAIAHCEDELREALGES